MGVMSTTQTLTSQGAGTPVLIVANTVPVFQPSVLCLVSNPGTLTYSVEVTCDNPPTASGNWVPFTNMSSLTSSQAGTVGAAITAVRPHVNAYTSGSLVFQVGQVNPIY